METVKHENEPFCGVFQQTVWDQATFTFIPRARSLWKGMDLAASTGDKNGLSYSLSGSWWLRFES